MFRIVQGKVEVSCFKRCAAPMPCGAGSSISCAGAALVPQPSALSGLSSAPDGFEILRLISLLIMTGIGLEVNCGEEA